MVNKFVVINAKPKINMFPKPATVTYPKRILSDPHPRALFLVYILILSSNICLCLQIVHSIWGPAIKITHDF
jgi:hypothetical protein